jgi:uncharacterized oxidoreductase
MPQVHHIVLRDFTERIFVAAGVPAEDAHIIADHLVTSNLVGHDSHGVWLVASYVQKMRESYVRWGDREVLRENPSLVLIDGHGANGIVAATHAVELAVAKARASTFGFVGLRNITHIARLGDYPPRIAAHGMIGSVWLNGGGMFLAPYGSAERRLRPEPIAFAVPRRHGPPFMLDITLSVAAGGKVEQKVIRDEPVPEGWLIDRAGRPVTDASRWRDPEIGMLPLGGMQFGHKGHGLAMMVEMIVGPLTLAGCTKGPGPDGGGGGTMLLAIDIEQFTDLETFTSEVESHAEWVTSAERLPGFDRIYAPGEREEETRRRLEATGIDVAPKTWDALLSTAGEMGVAVPAV